MGHIRTSMGSGEVELPDAEIEVGVLVDRLRSMSSEKDPGFSKYNTIAIVEGGEALVPASTSTIIRGGEKVVLIPFSHGG